VYILIGARQTRIFSSTYFEKTLYPNTTLALYKVVISEVVRLDPDFTAMNNASVVVG
jgi:hypothetical protein